MADRLCTREEFDAFEKVCKPWHVDERLRRDAPPLSLFGLTTGNAFLLKDLLSPPSPEETARKESEVVAAIWKEIEDLNYSKTLRTRTDYQVATQSFEKRLKAYDEREKFKRRVWFRYITGMAIYLLGPSRAPVRLLPDKDTARRVNKHIDALLEEFVNPQEYAYWADYDLVKKLRELKKELEASESVQRVGNTLSPEGYFAFYLAQRFLDIFGETMPAVIGDLCRVIGRSPDESTVQRWTTLAEEHHAKEKAVT